MSEKLSAFDIERMGQELWDSIPEMRYGIVPTQLPLGATFHHQDGTLNTINKCWYAPTEQAWNIEFHQVDEGGEERAL